MKPTIEGDGTLVSNGGQRFRFNQTLVGRTNTLRDLARQFLHKGRCGWIGCSLTFKQTIISEDRAGVRVCSANHHILTGNTSSLVDQFPGLLNKATTGTDQI